MAMAESERGLGGERQQGRTHRRHGRRRRRDPLASRRRRARASDLAGPSEQRSDPAKWDWVLWTPEGFYEATPGAKDVLKWVVNHGPDKRRDDASCLGHRQAASAERAAAHVLDQLETAHALGVDDMSQARLDVQAETGSAKPPGGVLHVLAIGVDKFGDKAGGLHLDYAAEDAHDVATALLDSQKGCARQGEPLRRRQPDLSA